MPACCRGVAHRDESSLCQHCKRGSPERFAIQVTHTYGETEVFSFEELALHRFKAAPRHIRVLRFQAGEAYSQEIISSSYPG